MWINWRNAFPAEPAYWGWQAADALHPGSVNTFLTKECNRQTNTQHLSTIFFFLLAYWSGVSGVLESSWKAKMLWNAPDCAVKVSCRELELLSGTSTQTSTNIFMVSGAAVPNGNAIPVHRMIFPGKLTSSINHPVALSINHSFFSAKVKLLLTSISFALKCVHILIF